MNNKNRRANKTASDADLYKVSKSSIKKFIKEERRHDELDRLREIQSQKRVWFYIFSACTFVIVALMFSAFLGVIQR